MLDIEAEISSISIHGTEYRSYLSPMIILSNRVHTAELDLELTDCEKEGNAVSLSLAGAFVLWPTQTCQIWPYQLSVWETAMKHTLAISLGCSN